MDRLFFNCFIDARGHKYKKLTDNGEYPQIDNGQVVWCYDYEIFLWDGQTVQQLTDNENYDLAPKMMDNGQVLWVGSVPETRHDEIFLWDGQTVHQLTNGSDNYSYVPATLQFDNGQMVWLGKDDPDNDYEDYDYEVFLWDGQTVHQLTDDNNSYNYPDIDNGQVVWYGYDGHDHEIFLWDGQTVHQLTDNDIRKSGVRIDNGQVVWQGNDGRDDEIFLWDGQTVHQLTDNDNRDSGVQIDNGQVVWQGNDGRDDEIFLWDGQTVHQLTDNDINDRYPQIDKGQIVWQQSDLDDEHTAIYYADTRSQSADQVLLFDFGSGAIPTDDDPENVWNNVTESVGCSNSGKLLDLITADGKTTQIDLVMQRRFNGSNPNGTWNSADFPSAATRDSLFGNTQTFNNLSNVLPKFKLTGLDPQKTFDVTFYASRMNPKDNRETYYFVRGANSGDATLNPVNNVDTVATVSGIQPNAAGEITIIVSAANNNTSNKHFSYLGVMKLEATAETNH